MFSLLTYFRELRVKYIMSALASSADIWSTSLSYIGWLNGMLNILRINVVTSEAADVPPPAKAGHSYTARSWLSLIREQNSFRQFLKIFCMKAFCSSKIMSWIKLSMAVNPLGERSVLEERLRREFMTESPMLMEFIETIRSTFLSLGPPCFCSTWYLAKSLWRRQKGWS